MPYLFAMESYVLGIDIGTGSTKAVAVNKAGAVLFATQHHYLKGFSHTSQDPEIIWTAFLAVIKDTLKVLPQPTAVSLSSAMHSVMALNEQYVPISPLLTWADDRAADLANTLLATPEGAKLYRACGTPIHAMTPLCKIRWWQLNDPELFASAHFFADIKAYIWQRLFGVLETDISIASATGMLSLETKDWHQPALEFAGINYNHLPKPVATTFSRNQLLPSSAEATGLALNTSFIMGASDGCLANLGTAALQSGTAAITIGTSGAVRVATKEPKPVFPEQLFNYYLDEGVWITGGAINNGGAAVQWIARTLGHDSITDELMQSITAIPAGANGLLFLPFLLGERAPIWDSHSSAAFVGLQHRHGPAHLLRAVIEGVCFALKSVLDALETSAGAVHTLHLSGGFTRSKAALQLLTDCLGKKVELLQTEDASAIGAALLGWKASGGAINLAALPMPEVVRTFEPDAEAHKKYQQLYALYQPLYGQLKDTMHQLQQLA
jgi:gluconokinase